MSKYLYGASVQGIQDFIFKTNKLQEIVGASEIVKSIETLFTDNFTADEILLNAAGNIKVIFKSEEECKKAVFDFPKMVMQKAYGITLSQAVVKIGDEYNQDDINELEKRLKIQRNKPSIPLDISINLMKLNPSTAKPFINKDNDKATQQKRDAYKIWFRKERIDEKDFENSKELSFISNSKNKIAVIHADGNGLGRIIPKLGDKLSSFSKELNIATNKAYENAIIENMKIRKVVLGGDDMTVICDANVALEFTRNFLYNFEEETKKIKELKGIIPKLTACAGIAFCNEKYPFHYAVSLAEALCGATKKHAKKINLDLAPSSLMFHNIQSSNFQTWKKFVEDELTISNDKQTIRCDFGPYYLDEKNQATIDNLQNSINAYKCEGSPISRLRNWMSELYKSDIYASNLLERINEVTQQSGKWKCDIMDKNLENLYDGLSNNNLIVQKDQEKDRNGKLQVLNKTPIYDILQILSTTDFKGEK